jgi:hypothetical protein
MILIQFNQIKPLHKIAGCFEGVYRYINIIALHTNKLEKVKRVEHKKGKYLRRALKRRAPSPNIFYIEVLTP